MKTMVCGKAAVKVNFKGRSAQQAAGLRSLKVLLSVCFLELISSFKPVRKLSYSLQKKRNELTFRFLLNCGFISLLHVLPELKQTDVAKRQTTHILSAKLH